MGKHLNIVMACLLCLAYRAQAGDWYQWRGPEQNGVSREKNLPESWSPEGENVLWSAPYGGMSCPIVLNGKVYALTRVGEVKDGDMLVVGPETREAVVCLDANTGAKLWQHDMRMTQTEVPFHRLGWSNMVGDPATGRVYCLGAQCNLVCFDGATGKVQWMRQMTEEFGMISTFGGRTPSPAIDGDQLMMAGIAFGWGDHARAQHRMFAFDKMTGELRWSNGTGGIPVDAPQNTPVVAVIDNQRLVIFAAGDGTVNAYQVRTGKHLWRYPISKRGLNATVLVNGSRVYVCNSEENINQGPIGSVVCLDASGGKVKEVWRRDGIEPGFPSPVFYDGVLYALDNGATLHALNAEDGKTLWTKRCGTIGKASPTYGDGKLYVCEANGKVTILKLPEPGSKTPKVLSRVELEEKLGREYAVYGSVAIANGRLYIQAANTMFCIGPKDPKVVSDPIPEPPREDLASGDHTVAAVQVLPFESTLHPGEKAKFRVKLFDSLGRPVEAAATPSWSVGKLTMALPPSATQPAGTPPTYVKVGNLKGSIAADGTFTAEEGGHQGGAIVATVNGVEGNARVRVLPPLPWKFDFEHDPVDRPPLTWLDTGGKYWVTNLEGNKVLDKRPERDLYYRARANFGTPEMSNYTIESDVRVGHKDFGGMRQMPDPGILNQRYVLMLYGSHQRAQIHVWSGALPRDAGAAAALAKTIDFKWEPDKWYRMKLRVDQLPDKAVARGKIWPADQSEPSDWLIELEDVYPNRSGNPGVFGHSMVTPYKSNIYFDNIIVSENK